MAGLPSSIVTRVDAHVVTTDTGKATRGLSVEEIQAIVRDESREATGEKRTADEVERVPIWHLQEFEERPPEPEFNYLPYLVLAAVLLGMAYITDER